MYGFEVEPFQQWGVDIACHKSEARCLTPYYEMDTSRVGLLEMIVVVD